MAVIMQSILKGGFNNFKTNNSLINQTKLFNFYELPSKRTAELLSRLKLELEALLV